MTNVTRILIAIEQEDPRATEELPPLVHKSYLRLVKDGKSKLGQKKALL